MNAQAVQLATVQTSVTTLGGKLDALGTTVATNATETATAMNSMLLRLTEMGAANQATAEGMKALAESFKTHNRDQSLRDKKDKKARKSRARSNSDRGGRDRGKGDRHGIKSTTEADLCRGR